MIPKRIKLKGFLCYRDEQEIAFDGASLWMLTGLNGSGKSTVFDALTFALFSHHRGGSSGATDLITKGENGFAVEFDFVLEGQLYQICRTLRRKGTGTSATQQISRWTEDRWEPVPDAGNRKGFDIWIAQHVGLNYETFTSSVLLLQGHAEKLLNGTPKDRAGVLAGIVELERYQRLAEKADQKRKEHKFHFEEESARLRLMPEVTGMELAAARNCIEEADEAQGKAQQEAERLQALEFQAKQWADWQRKLGEAQQRQKKAGGIVQEAAAIDKDLNRLRELREIMPHVETIFLQRTNLSQSQDVTKALSDSVRELEGRLNQREHELEQLRSRRVNLQKNIGEDDAKMQENGKKLPHLFAQVKLVELVEKGQAEVQRLEDELAGLPADFGPRLAEAQRKIEELTALQQALPHLSRLQQSRLALQQAVKDTDAGRKCEKELAAHGERIKAKLEALRPTAEAAKIALQTTQNKLASEKALLQEATKLRDMFDELEEAKLCRACGQPLTPKHYREEKARREKERKAADARVKEATSEAKAAQDAEKQLSAEMAGREKQIQTARDEYKDNHHHLTQAENEVQRLSNECGHEYEALAPSFRARVAVSAPTDWLATTFPAVSELEVSRRTVLGLPKLQNEQTQLRETAERWQRLKSRVDDARKAADELAATLAGKPDDIRRDFARLDADQNALAKALEIARKEDRAQQGEIERASEDCQQFREKITEQQAKLRGEDEKRKLYEQAMHGARKALSPDWQVQVERVALAEFNRLKSEREDLEKAGVEERAEQLKQARIEIGSLKQTIADLQREISLFPEEARCDLAQLQVRLQQARASAKKCSEELNAARNEQANLEQRGKQRAEVQVLLAGEEREHKLYELLAKLLGRDRLQRHLVRQAERQIVDYGNGVLDRLSSGQLMLRLCPGEEGAGADKALDLECVNRETGESPINVAFLSGSQRFRVAVSLALGIGQYASRQHRPIESVIIDEGFGCLDRNGRQVMIQELHNLRGQLKCILLVSHQDEFADAFADGYRFELTNGSTKVTRFQK